MNTKLDKSVFQFMKEHFFELNNKKIIVGLSGGVDSVGLLLWLSNHSVEYNIQIKAVHINHQIRDVANDDEKFCKNICLELGIEFKSYRYNIPLLSKEQNMSEEEMGRIVRKDCLNDELENSNYDYIFLAHHIEDRCETIIHNIVRGTGIDGLTGMVFQNAKIIRPFLDITKDEIIDYVNSYGYSWVEDCTNNDINYTRNYIRKEIIPKLEKINPKAINHIASLGDKILETKSALDNKSDTYYTKQLIRTKLYNLAGTIKDISSNNINGIMGLIDNNVGKQIMLPLGIIATKTYDNIEFRLGDKIVYLYNNSCDNKSVDLIVDNSDNIKDNFNVEIIKLEDSLGQNPDLYSKCISNNTYTKYFDYDIIKGDVNFRFREHGDYIGLVLNHHTKLKDFMINTKIPSEYRDNIPLVATGNDVLWVVGFRTNINYHVTESTKNIIKITYINNLGE